MYFLYITYHIHLIFNELKSD